MTMMRVSEWNRGIELRRQYDKEFRPLILEEKYDEAVSYLGENPEVENYLGVSEWKELFKYSQSQLKAAFEAWTACEISLSKDKTLEGKTKLGSLYQSKQEGVSI
jgi:hypothetical protein